jgi:hypothetical protein
MVGNARGLLVATMVGTLGLASRVAAQPPAAPMPVLPGPATVPVTPPLTPPDPGPGPIISRPVPVVTQPVQVPPPGPPVTPSPFAPAPYNPPPAGPPPQTYGTYVPEPLTFFNAELQFAAPTVSNHLHNTIVLPDGTTKAIAIPGVALDFTVAPLLEIGYMLPDHAGRFSFGYRFLTTQGTSSQTADGVETAFRSRFDFNELNFDYGTARWEFEPHWFLQARLGARVAWTYYDTTARTDLLGLKDFENNYFVGAGPHVSLDLERTVANGFGLFAKVDAAVLIGQDQQTFTETDNVNGFVSITDPPRTTLAVPTLQAQVGVSYTPPRFEHLRFRTGYQFEQWFNLGSVQGSSLNFMTQGGFIRGEIDF